MSYTYDVDLEFLKYCTDEQLRDFADILIYDKDGEYRFTETITHSDVYQKYGNNYSKY